jgi:hypothetical protein
MAALRAVSVALLEAAGFSFTGMEGPVTWSKWFIVVSSSLRPRREGDLERRSVDL